MSYFGGLLCQQKTAVLFVLFNFENTNLLALNGWLRGARNQPFRTPVSTFLTKKS